eukprot:301176_1
MPSSSPSIQNTTSNISGKKIHYLQPTYLFPLLSYLFYLITSITGFVSMFHSHDHHYICHWTIIIGTMSYPLGKMWMYLVFIYRLYIVYIDSIFEYNRKLIIGMMSAVVFYSLTLAIVNTLTVSDITAHMGNNLFLCEPKFQIFIVEAVVVFDVITNGICCYLFIRPLLLLSKKNENDLGMVGIFNTALKCIILTLVAVTSTVIMMTFVEISGLVAFVTIDVSINCIVIMLFNKEYNKQYKRMCSRFIKLGVKCFKYRQTKDKSVKSRPQSNVETSNAISNS